MVNLISFGEINKYLFFPFIGGIVKLFVEFYLHRFNKDLTTHPLINGLNESIGFSLALIPFLIFNFKKRKNQEKNDYYLKFDSKIFLLVLSSFLVFLQKYILYCINHFDMINLWLFDIIFFSFFSYLILGQKLYIHQFISFIILFICSSIFFYFYFSVNEMKLIDFIVLVFVEILFCSSHVLIKYIFDNKNCTGWEINTYEGILSLILFLILLIPLSQVEIDKNSKIIKIFKHINYGGKIYLDNFEYFRNLTFIDYLNFIFSSIIREAYNIFNLFTLKYFTPSHIIIILLSDEIYTSLKLIINLDIKYIIGICILYPITYFSIFVFVEIIELNFCNLSLNTRKNIINRYKDETDKEKINEINLIYSSSSENNTNRNNEISIRPKDKGRDT